MPLRCLVIVFRRVVLAWCRSMKVSACRGLLMVRSRAVAGGAKFGEKELRRGAVCFRWGCRTAGAKGNTKGNREGNHPESLAVSGFLLFCFPCFP